jgi:flagellar hook-length control protein FliK
MQVNPALPAVVNSPANSTRETLQSDVVQLLAPSPQARVQHEQAVERREDKLRHRESVQQELAAQAAAAPRPSEQIFKAERDLAPGSHAARDQQLHEQVQERASQKTSGFRQVLAEASGRGSAERPPSTPRPSTPASSTDAPAAPASKPAEATEPSTPTAATRPGATTPASASASNARPAAAQATVTPSPMRMVSLAANNPASIRVPAIASPAASMRAGTGPRPAGANPAAAVASRTAPANAKATLRQPAAAEPEPRTDDTNLERIVRFIQTRIGKERSSATLRLEPPELGTIRLRMELRDQQLSLEVQTRTAAARQLLTDQVETLRRSLEATGIHLDRVDIRAPASTDAPNSHSSPQTGSWTGPEGSNARQDSGSAGGGLPWESAPPGTEAAEPPEATAFWEPVAESLVNVLA